MKDICHSWIAAFTVLCLIRNIHCFLQNNDWEKVVNAARCRVKCLSSLQPPSDLHILRSRPKQSSEFSRCMGDQECRECLKPCSQPYVSLPLCKRICEPAGPSSESCVSSCEFLHEIYTIHSGTCPPPDELTAVERSCEEQCELDIDCSTHTKCCTNSCGHTCQEAWSPFQGMPSIPEKPIIREKIKGGSIDLKWDLPNNQLRDHLLFIIEHRWNVGYAPSESHMTSWQQVLQTVSTSVSIKEITPGYWYQFRVSAVNQHGSRGVSQPTDPYRLSREPDSPGMPRNLTEGDTIIKNSKIGVIIKWLPPKRSDLPVSRYKIFWSKNGNGALPSDGEHRHVIDGEELQYIIPELEPDTTYLVQIQAISQYGDQRLKSERASIYITTYPLPQKVKTGNIDIRPLPKPSPVEGLNVHEPFFQNGLIKANVTWEIPPPIPESADHVPQDGGPSNDEYDDSEEVDVQKSATVHRVLVSWQPEVCIADTLGDGLSQTFSISTQEQFFVIYDLRFACHYSVKVQTVSPEGVTGPAKLISFPTPICQEIPVRGITKPDCPTNDPRTPEEPIHPEYSIVINKNNITARLSWFQPLSDTPITNYKVVWGQGLITDLLEPSLDPTTAFTKILPKDALSYSITSLREATSYVAEVSALSKAGEGETVKMVFSTPILALKPLDPPYRRVTVKDNHQRRGTSLNHHEYQPGDDINPTPSLVEQTNQLGYRSGAQSPRIDYMLLLCILSIAITVEMVDAIDTWFSSLSRGDLILLKQR